MVDLGPFVDVGTVNSGVSWEVGALSVKTCNFSDEGPIYLGFTREGLRTFFRWSLQR